MLVISVELLHGTIRTGSPDDTAMAGGAESGEWPPSPARLFAALVSGGGTRARSVRAMGEELSWLEALPPPQIQADPPGLVEVSPLQGRFVVVDETSQGAVQNYPARTSASVRPGVRQSPANASITYVWPEADPTVDHLDSLRYRAARIGYLGCADSPVRVAVTEAVRAGTPEDAWVPDSGVRSSTLPVPYTGLLKVLDRAYDNWCDGVQTRRVWLPTVRQGYRAPGKRTESAEAAPLVVWLRFDRPLTGRHLTAVTGTLRSAVMDHLQRSIFPEHVVPALIHGHRSPGDGPEQACFLALPNVGQRHADGRLFGAAVLLPAATDGEVVQSVWSALSRLSAEKLTKPNWFEVKISVHSGEERPWACNPKRWSGPARRWESVTPVVFERWTKGAPSLDEVALWCTHANLPAPIATGFQRHPTVPGALDLHPTEVFSPQKQRRPYSHMWIEFERPLRGPVVIGKGRYLGLGLMVPTVGTGIITNG